MKRFLFATIAVILTLLPLAARADDEPQETKAKKICATVAGFKPGPNARPSDEDRKRFAAKSRDCLDYVYGYVDPKKRDLDKGRRCCLARCFWTSCPTIGWIACGRSNALRSTPITRYSMPTS